MVATYREARPADADFIAQMLAEAASWDRPAGTPSAPLSEVLAISQIADHIEGWGRTGDGGVIVEIDGRPAGACWFRLMTAEHPGYGFIAPHIPDVGLAVSPAFQGRGIGRRLLEAAIGQARELGFASLGISVAEGNRRARRLYESVGFVAIDREGTSLTMRLDLAGAAPEDQAK